MRGAWIVLISTIETYKEKYKISGKEAYDLFEKSGAAKLILRNYEYYNHVWEGDKDAHDMIKKYLKSLARKKGTRE